MDDLDFSKLLNERPVPADGAARARQTVATRRHRRQAVGSTFGFVAVLALGFGIFNASKGPDHVVVNNVGHSTITTSIETTTTTNPDPRAHYVGSEHTGEGSGLPIDTRFINSGPSLTGDYKAGDHLVYWVRDKVGDMVWFDTVTANDTNRGVVTSKTDAVFPVPTLQDNETVCINDCGFKRKSGYATNVVGVWSDDKFSAAWSVDFVKMALTPRVFSDLSTGASAGTTTTTTSIPSDPKRPDLYGVIAQCQPDDCAWYRQNEQVTAGGGGGPSADFYSIFMTDNQAKKYVVVWLQGTTVHDTLVVDQSQGQPLPNSSDYLYKGKSGQPLLITSSGGKVTAAWVLDGSSHKIVSVDPSDLSKPKNASK